MKSNSSRLGVRGSEALGGGLSAVFQIESAVGATNGGGLGSTLGTRETFVGLQGGWGTFKMGYFLTPYDDIHPIFGNVPTLATSYPGHASALVEHGLGRQLSVRRRIRRPRAEFDALRLAEHRRLHRQRAGRRRARGWRSDQRTASITSGIVASGTPTARRLPQQRRHAYLLSLNGLYNNGPFQGGIAYEFHNNFRPQADLGTA